MNYEDMTDFEINSAVTADINHCAAWEINDTEFYHCGIDGSSYYSIPILDYCNSPADAWPIIDGSRINIKYDGNGGGAFADEYGSLVVRHKNKLRAAMIVYLMMQDEL